MLVSPDVYQKYLPNLPNPTSKDRLSVKNQQNILNLELLDIPGISGLTDRVHIYQPQLATVKTNRKQR